MYRVTSVFAYPFREPVNGFTHLFGAFAALAGMVWLLNIPQSDPAVTGSVIVYGLSMIVLYTSSAIYHLNDGSDYTQLWLQRLDHGAIYLLIAGCYTPVCISVIHGEWRWILLGLVWLLALAGIIYKMLFLIKPGMFSLIYYIIMACVGLVAPREVLAMIPALATALILISGLLFLTGAIIFGFEKPNLHPKIGYHELWHLFVLAGSAFHFFAVYVCLRQ
ncbi:MAG: hemolysin III family protein [Anaerolineae bacterium]